MANNLKYTIHDKIQLYTEQQSSGLVMTEWCSRNNVNYGSFKNFPQAIREYYASNNAPQEKKVSEKTNPNKVSWISTGPMTIANLSEKNNLNDPVNKSYIATDIQYLIEIGAFKIHVPENIKPSSLKILVEVLSQCS